MKPPIRDDRRLRLVSFVAMVITPLLLAFIGFELLHEFRSIRETRRQVEQSYETRSQIQSVFRLLQEAEAGMRGYIITGQPHYLEPYDRARRDLDDHLTRLEILFDSRQDQREALRSLNALAGLRITTLGEPVEARRTQGAEAAARLVSSGEGKAVMDEIRIVIDRMSRNEAAALRARTERAEARSDRTEQLVAGMFMLLVVGALTVGFLIWRYLRTRRSLLGELEAIAARQQAVFDSAIDGIVTFSPDGKIETVNPAAEHMFGYTAAELKQTDVNQLVTSPQGTPLAELSKAAVREGGMVRELTAHRRDGVTFPIDVALTAMQLSSGWHTVTVVRDISERRRVDEMKTEFVSTVSHELRTPMTSIAGSLGLLAGGAAGELPEKAARLISIAQANSQRLVRLINDILDIEKIESGQLRLVLEPMDLRQIAERSIEGLRGLADSLNITLTLQDGQPAPVRGDADRLIQVVTNLLSNAAKFSPTGGEVVISVHPEQRIARLSVCDRGPGIPEAFRSRIFSRFAQADSSDTRAKGGTGLGLVISREIAERHGGRLWFESDPGDGATFHLDLPLLDAPVVAATDGPRLLICEDDADAADLLREMLERDGYRADITPTAREALNAARSGEYRAVLVDLHLPDADGISLIRALRAGAETRHLPVVVISGDTARGRARGRTLEVVDWLEKPFDEARLREAVASMLEAPGRPKPRILHVDDDADILEVTASALSGTAIVTGVGSLAEARAALAQDWPDLVILDLGLPDGSGLELLADLGDETGRTLPVVVYSAQEGDAALAHQVEAVLTKSRTSLAGLARTVRRLTAVAGQSTREGA